MPSLCCLAPGGVRMASACVVGHAQPSQSDLHLFSQVWQASWSMALLAGSPDSSACGSRLALRLELRVPMPMQAGWVA